MVFSMPVYWFSIPAQIKGGIDRLFSFVVGGKDIAGKECAVIARLGNHSTLLPVRADAQGEAPASALPSPRRLPPEAASVWDGGFSHNFKEWENTTPVPIHTGG